MKLLIPLVFLVTLTASGRVNKFLASENDPHSRHYLLLQRTNGQYEVEDLWAEETPIIRAVPSDVTYYFYSRTTGDEPFVIKGGQESLLSSTSFDPAKKTYFIIHGWNNAHDSNVNRLIEPALLEAADLNVFVVDWSGPADESYTSAKKAVDDVGNFVGEVINTIIGTYGLTVSNIVCVGHSLGAHVCGKAGSVVNGQFDHIVGLDPASPLFSLSDPNTRLDTTDASFVQIIHTCGGLLGFSSPIGHSDYYPNGGSNQEGCGLDLSGTCAHSRAYMYFAESLRDNQFVARQCDSMSDYDQGSCNSNTRSLMGGLEIDKNVNGVFYLATNDAEPFGRGE